jgi:hypothetical protein
MREMPKTKPSETTLQLVLPVEAKKALETMAQIEEIASVSELIRQLLSNYCQNNGIDVDFTVGPWGGRRERPKLKSTEADETLTPTDVRIVNDLLQFTLADGRVIAHPLAWYPWLAKATPQQFANRLMTPIAIYWPDLEDGISIETLLQGPPERVKARVKA